MISDNNNNNNNDDDDNNKCKEMNDKKIIIRKNKTGFESCLVLVKFATVRGSCCVGSGEELRVVFRSI